MFSYCRTHCIKVVGKGTEVGVFLFDEGVLRLRCRRAMHLEKAAWSSSPCMSRETRPLTALKSDPSPGSGSFWVIQGLTIGALLVEHRESCCRAVLMLLHRGFLLIWGRGASRVYEALWGRCRYGSEDRAGAGGYPARLSWARSLETLTEYLPFYPTHTYIWVFACVKSSVCIIFQKGGGSRFRAGAHVIAPSGRGARAALLRTSFSSSARWRVSRPVSWSCRGVQWV